VNVLGPGRRIGIWLQGCSIGCYGCIAKDTWKTGVDYEIPVGVVLAWCRKVDEEALGGVTISGGEPFEQPEALGELLDGLREWDQERRNAGRPPLDLLGYSGLPFRVLKRDHGGLLAHLDAVIPEPYLASQPRPGEWRGSSNQPLVPLSELGRQRYPAGIDAEHETPSIQVSVEGTRVWMIGIPRRGDLVAFQKRAEEKGLHFEEVSWRA
jgi:anaerobic ribonucleoside-triphosphate reductase activating protein